MQQMTESTSYEPGTPCWVDFASPDLDASIEFYGGLFGWEVPESENPEQTGGYRLAMKNGKPVAGMMPLMQEGQPPAWTTYVSVEDADGDGGRGQGGRRHRDRRADGRHGPRHDGGLRRPDRRRLRGLAARARSPAPASSTSRARSPGTSSTPATSPAAKEFYGAVFGWNFDDQEMDGGETYTMIVLGERPGRRHPRHGRPQVPEEIPAHWLVYFAVEDTDATIEAAKEAGGGVMLEPIDIPFGRFAILTDPHGASFAVIALSEMAPRERLTPRAS